MLVVGVAAALATGLFVGLFVVRYRYIFFGMLNLALSMILFSVLEKFYHVTGGSDGMRIPRPTVLGLSLGRDAFEDVLFYDGLGLAVLVAWAVARWLDSPVGHMLQAIKTNETRLEYLGVSARRVLLAGYVISAGLCGPGGVLMALAQGVVTPDYAWWVRSGGLVFIAVLGGAHSVGGAFAGAAVYEIVRAYAAAFAGEVWQMTLGFAPLAIILYAPRGLAGLGDRIRPSRRPAGPAPRPAAEPAE